MNGAHNKQKLNPIDILIVLLFILVIASAIYFFSESNDIFSQNACDIEYEIFIDSIPHDLANNISPGDIIYDSTTSFQIGTVIDVKVEYVKQGNAQLKLALKTKAKNQNGSLSVNGVQLDEGNAIDFRSVNLAYHGILRNILVISNQGA